MYKPKTPNRPIPFNGNPSSHELRAAFDELRTDILGVAGVANDNEAAHTEMITILFNEIKAMKAQVMAQKDVERMRNTANINTNYPVLHVESFSDSDDLTHHESTPAEHRANFEQQFRNVTPPKNNAISMFYGFSSSNPGEIIQREVPVEVTPRFDGGNWEYDGELTTGEVSNAFNGNNNSFWVRKVSFPLHSDVDTVKLQITIDVPQGQYDANVLQLIPAPFNSVTIEDIEYISTDYGSSFRSLSELLPQRVGRTVDELIEFNPIINSEPEQFFFSPMPVTRLRITISQPNWQEENGRKVFYYGFQEIGLWYVEYEPTANVSSKFSVTDNNNIIAKIEAPDGYIFDKLTFFDATPYDNSNTHLLWEVSEDISFDPPYRIWSSDLPRPQQTLDYPTIGLAGRARKIIYVKATLNLVGGDAGPRKIGCPFPDGTPAYVDSFAMQFLVNPEVQ